ncbi:MAG: flagellar basal body rod protein FlgB [Oscillospiraceae bacterium]|nr:flagellar basal body rod protein FlgB [Oscillospiraceae bacterium]
MEKSGEAVFGKIFRQVDTLARGLDASWLRQEVIAQNIANANTPYYKSRRVEFEGALTAALSERDGFAARRTRDRHIAFGDAADPRDVTPSVVTNDHYTMRMDGNNVDIDQENVELAKNTIKYDMLTVKMNAELARLKMAIREGN